MPLFERLPPPLNRIDWRTLGHGKYNKAYVSDNEFEYGGYTSRWVLKLPSPQEDPVCAEMNTNERAVRLWKTLNPDYPAYTLAYTELDGVKIQAWIAPYLGTRPAPDNETAAKLIAIYREENRIVADGVSLGNFLLFERKVVCVDVDLALRRGSIATDNYMGTEGPGIPSEFASYMKQCDHYGPLTTLVIRTLFYLEQYLSPDEIKKEYITFDFLAKLSMLCKNNMPLTAAMVERIFALGPTDISDDCLTDLLRIGNFRISLAELRVIPPYSMLLFNKEVLSLLSDDITFEIARELPGEDLLDLLNLKIHSAPAEDGELHVIHIAARNGILALIKKLITANPALVNVKDSKHHTPLMFAVAKGHEAVVKFLVEQSNIDFDLTAQVSSHMTLLQYAMRYPRIAAMLEDAVTKRQQQHSLSKANPAATDRRVIVSPLAAVGETPQRPTPVTGEGAFDTRVRHSPIARVGDALPAAGAGEYAPDTRVRHVSFAAVGEGPQPSAPDRAAADMTPDADVGRPPYAGDQRGYWAMFQPAGDGDNGAISSSSSSSIAYSIKR